MDSAELCKKTEELLDRIRALKISDRTVEDGNNMDPKNLKVMLDAAIEQAVLTTKNEFQSIIANLTAQVESLRPPSAPEDYREIEIRSGVQCDESLDIVKSVPEFKGEQEKYVSWRQAATTAHKLFEPHVGSSKYFQAVAILRNKVTGNADTALSAYNTVLNFKAIIARLDFTYMDKKSIFTLEQELSTLRQGQKTILNFYDEVERKLTAIINKVIMSHEGDNSLITSLNQKYRDDALRVFVSGLRKPLCDTLFSCKPSDLPTALALAQELETNQNRYHFAAIYNNGLNRVQQNPHTHLPPRQNQQNSGQNTFTVQRTYPQVSPINLRQQVPYFQNRPESQRHNTFNSVNHPHLRFNKNANQHVFNPPQNSNQHVSSPPQNSLALESDVSMRTMRSNNFQGFQAQKRGLTSDKQIPYKTLRVNHLGHEVSQNENFEELYDCVGEPDVQPYQDSSENQSYTSPAFEDEINFLEEDQYSPILKE